MTTATITGVFSCDVERVWEVVTDVERYPAWRSDVDRCEWLDAARFVEYTKDGDATFFTVTAQEPCRRWEFQMENANMQGHWRGVFEALDGTTRIEFTEEVKPKKFFLIPFVKAYLKKQQTQFVADLRRTLE